MCPLLSSSCLETRVDCMLIANSALSHIVTQNCAVTFNKHYVVLNKTLNSYSIYIGDRSNSAGFHYTSIDRFLCAIGKFKQLLAVRQNKRTCFTLQATSIFHIQSMVKYKRYPQENGGKTKPGFVQREQVCVPAPLELTIQHSTSHATS